MSFSGKAKLYFDMTFDSTNTGQDIEVKLFSTCISCAALSTFASAKVELFLKKLLKNM